MWIKDERHLFAERVAESRRHRLDRARERRSHQELGAAVSLRALLAVAVRSCKRLVPVQSASFFLTGEDDGSMLRVGIVQDEHGHAVQGELAVTRIRDVRLGLVGHTLSSNAPTIVQDTSADANFDASIDCAPGYVVRSVLCAPIPGSHGRLLGALQLCNRLTSTGPGGKDRAYGYRRSVCSKKRS